MKNLLGTCAVLALTVGAVQAHAQTTDQPNAAVTADSSQPPQAEPPELSRATEAKDKSDLVVTGTLIHGVAPAGTETLTLTPEDIKEAGGLTTNDVLARIPQTSFFNTQIRPAPGQIQGIDTPSIHGLPTLIMLDGHRIASAGTSVTSVDPDIIPKGVLQGIEIVPDGGSAIYGSDAVGGVINLTTRKRFDGVDIDGNVGFANNYRSYRVDATIGKAWGTGSIYLAYAFDKQTPLFGYDRPYLQRIPARTECYPGTISINSFSLVTFTNAQIAQFAYPGVDANGRPTSYTSGTNTCNEYTNESVTPEQHMHSVFAGLSQDLNSAIRVDIHAFYSTRRSLSQEVFFTEADASVPKTNFYYTPTPIETAPTCIFNPIGCSQSAGISFAPAVGPSTPSPTQLDTWGVSEELTADVGHGFQVRLLGNYSQSYFNSSVIGVDSGLLSTALAGTTIATALDPYNVAATPQSLLLAQEIDAQKQITTGRTNEAQARLVADGTLFHLPGGDVKVAVGEIIADRFASVVQNLTYNGGVYQPTQTTKGTRTVASAFGELEIPLVSPENNVPLIHALRVSAAGRYDHYNDFGGTFNPRIAASWLPVEWVTIRGTYGHSFVAPQLTQEFSAQSGTIAPGIPFLLPPGDTADSFRNLIILTGGNPNLKPQKARTWTVGGDFRTPFLPGLKASITYYDVTYNNQIGSPPFTSPSLFYTGLYAPFYLRGSAAGGVGVPFAAASALVGNIPVSGSGFTSLAQMYGAGGAVTASSPVIIADARFQNLAIVKTSGLDFSLDYRHPTSFGSVNFGVAGDYILVDTASPVPGAAFVDQLPTLPDFNGSVTAGANVGDFRVSANLLHTAGYALTPGTSPFGQLTVKSYDTVNAFLSYTLKNHGFLNDTELTLNVNNIFDVRPAVNTAGSLGYSGGSIIGRLFQVGLHHKF